MELTPIHSQNTRSRRADTATKSSSAVVINTINTKANTLEIYVVMKLLASLVRNPWKNMCAGQKSTSTKNPNGTPCHNGCIAPGTAITGAVKQSFQNSVSNATAAAVSNNFT